VECAVCRVTETATCSQCYGTIELVSKSSKVRNKLSRVELRETGWT
jgi:hypothetical protein